MVKGKRLKRVLAILLTVMVCVQFVLMDDLKVVKAATSGDWTYTLINDGTEVEITRYNGSSGSVTIPDFINGNKVTSIGEGAFSEYTLDKPKLISIAIPKGVTNIGEQAFARCKGLRSITIPEGVTTIGDYAFLNSGLNNVIIPTSVTTIGYRVFYGTPWLTGKQIENPLVIVNTILIDGSTCKGDVTIPEGVTSICDAFTDCSGLTSITIPEGVTNIDGFAFYGCSRLKNITIPDSVTNIGQQAFYGCSSLSSISIPKGISFIDYATFYGCSSLSSISIPEGVTDIYLLAFNDCSNLANITIPKSVTNIGWGAFLDTAWLINKQKEHPIVAVNNILIDGSKCEGAVTIPDNITSIGAGAFQECIGITNVALPDSVTCIGEQAFYSCSNLTSITIPDTVTCIGMYAFANCEKLTNIIIPEGVTVIHEGTFSGCSNLASVRIPDSIVNIYYNYSYSERYENVFYNYSYSERYENVFYNCPDELTIYANAGSYAETWAKEHGFNTATISSDIHPDGTETDNQNTNNPNTANQSDNQNEMNQSTTNQSSSTKDTATSNKVTIPKVAKVKQFKAKAKRKGFILSWKKVSGANGYKLQISTKKSFTGAKTITIKKNKTSYKLTKLKAKKKYYIRIRAYKNYKNANGKTKKAYGAYVSLNKKTK